MPRTPTGDKRRPPRRPRTVELLSLRKRAYRATVASLRDSIPIYLSAVVTSGDNVRDRIPSLVDLRGMRGAYWASERASGAWHRLTAGGTLH
jgi:hypothetical protein